MAKKSEADRNLAEEIRKYMSEHPEDGPTAVAEGLKKIGINTTPAYVSTIKNLNKKKDGGGRGSRTKVSGEISYATLLQAKKLANLMGGIEQARRALDALAELVD